MVSHGFPQWQKHECFSPDSAGHTDISARGAASACTAIHLQCNYVWYWKIHWVFYTCGDSRPPCGKNKCNIGRLCASFADSICGFSTNNELIVVRNKLGVEVLVPSKCFAPLVLKVWEEFGCDPYVMSSVVEPSQKLKTRSRTWCFTSPCRCWDNTFSAAIWSLSVCSSWVRQPNRGLARWETLQGQESSECNFSLPVV